MLKIKPWPITIVYVFIILIFAFGLGLGVRRLPDIGQPRSDTEVWIYKDHNVTQLISPKNNGINVITVYMRNIGLRNQKPLTFTLINSMGQIVREINLNGYNVGDGDSVRFQFTPIADSGGKTYQLVFSSPESVFSDAIGVGYAKSSISYQVYYFPSGKVAVIKVALITFFSAVLRPQYIILFVVLGLLSLGFGLLLFAHV